MSMGVHATAPDPDRPFPVRPGRIVAWAVWFGLVSGGLGLLTFLLQCRWLDPRNTNVSRHFPWMFLAAGLIVQGVPALALALTARVLPARARLVVVLWTLAFLAFLDVLCRWPIKTTACIVLAAGLATQTAAFLARRPPAFDRWVRRSLPALIGISGVILFACLFGETLARRSAVPTAPARAGAKNVLLVVLDTVRAESLSLYGYDRDTSPNLCRYAERGVRFDRAFSTAPWTAPSHASMFTGCWAHELSIAWDRPLDGARPTLAEFLAGHGYDTAGFVANTTYCSEETGLSRGFARYEDYDVTLRSVLLCSALVRRAVDVVHKRPALARLLGEDRPASSHRKSAERINRDVLGWLDGRPNTRPFFAFLNYYDAHHPYLTPEPEPPSRPGATDDLRLLRTWWEADKRALDPRQVALARDAYDACIAYLDRQVGALLDELDRRGVLESTLVVVTADHGEHLGEQRLYGHGCSLYRPELHVPLLVLEPGGAGAGRVVREPVSLRDLAATVADVLGLRADAPFPGRSLASAWSDRDDRAAFEPAPVLSEIDAPPEFDPNLGGSPVRKGPMRSLVGWGYHYIRNGDGREELFDLDLDPQERRDLARVPDLAPALARFRTVLGSETVVR